jgi:hypothetical protein
VISFRLLPGPGRICGCWFPTIEPRVAALEYG